MNVLLVGISGKMGQSVVNVSGDKLNIIAGIDKNILKINKYIEIHNNFLELNKEIIHSVDIVLDFALPDVLSEELEFCIKNNKPLVICSTGHSSEQLKLIEEASKKIPIFKTTNTSLGIAFINSVLKNYSNIIKDYKVDIIDKHHKLKKDVPSGTTKTFQNILKKKGIESDYHSIRAGSIVGEHQICLSTQYEQVNINHIAENRNLFALGAIKICEFFNNVSECRLYNMEDLLNK